MTALVRCTGYIPRQDGVLDITTVVIDYHSREERQRLGRESHNILMHGGIVLTEALCIESRNYYYHPKRGWIERRT